MKDTLSLTVFAVIVVLYIIVHGVANMVNKVVPIEDENPRQKF